MNVLIRERRKKVVNKDIVFAERYVWSYFKALLSEANFKVREVSSQKPKHRNLNATCEDLALNARLVYNEIEVLDCISYLIELETELNINDRVTYITGRYHAGDFSKFFRVYGDTLLDCSRRAIEGTSMEYFDKQDESWSLKVCRG